MEITSDTINDKLRELAPELETQHLGYFLRKTLEGPLGYNMGALFRYVPLGHIKRALDVGSGLGHWLALLHSRTGASVVGMEPNAKKVGISTEMLLSFGIDAEVVQQPAHDISGIEGPFDIITSLDTLYDYYPDPVAFWARMAPLVSPGGFMAVDWYVDEDERKPKRSYIHPDHVLAYLPTGFTSFLTLTRVFSGRTIALFVLRKSP